MEEIKDNIKELIPTYRVLDREKNLNFFRKFLGMKVISEENAVAFLGGNSQKSTRLILEETPDARSVQGIKKHNYTVIQAEESEVEQLLARNIAEISKVYQVKNSWAFEVVSPENGKLIVVSVDDWSNLVEVDKSEVDFDAGEFSGLSDFKIIEIGISIATDNIISEYEAMFDVQVQDGLLKLPQFNLAFVKVSGADLSADLAETLDQTLLIFKVEQTFDLLKFAEKLRELNKFEEVFFAKKGKTVAVEISNHLEFWFTKRDI